MTRITVQKSNIKLFGKKKFFSGGPKCPNSNFYANMIASVTSELRVTTYIDNLDKKFNIK